jgi:DNA adenine methylase
VIAHPFVKWAGGKRQIAPEILRRLPASIRTYHEPFLGAGAIFFALIEEGRVSAAILNDRNAELVTAYYAIAKDPEGVIAVLRDHKNTKEAYLAVRAQDPWKATDAARAARFIYLNRCGFNGLYRVNASGGFNVPFGKHANPTICDADNLRAVSLALAGVRARIYAGDFETTLLQHWPGAGDAVYFDPPYWPVSKTANFTGYQAGGFGPDEQRRLRDVAVRVRESGAAVLLSNADVPEVRELYRNFAIDRVEVRRAINRDASKRGPVGEVLISGVPS